MPSALPGADTTPIDHRPGCDTSRHTDPADSCYTPSVTVAGLSTYVDLTHRLAYSPQLDTPGWTAKDCTALCAMFTELGRHLEALGA